MTQQRQSSRDSHAVHAASERREFGRESGWRENHGSGSDPADRSPPEPERPEGILAELKWGREG